jgi:hypothetical protein
VSPLLDRSEPRPASDEFRASLAAVEAAREAARLRLRRDTRRVRLLTLAVLGMTGAAAFGLVNRARASRRAAEAARAVAVEAAAAPVTPPEPTPTMESAAAAATPAPAIAPPVAARDVGPPDEQSAPVDADSTRADCREAYAAHRWRTAIEACGRAFEALPTEAALAMKVAQAQHARGHYAAAGEWAHRAIAVGGADPEAFVIVAHAERRARHPAAARSAYRQYLALAPRGWHASEARASVRASRPTTGE